MKNYLSKMAVTADTVKDLISSDTVVIFSKSYCPFCKMAKEVFDGLKQKYTAIEIEDREDMDQVQDVLGQMTGARSIPRVFVNGEFVGGGTDIKKLHETGKLQALLP